jgi:hypothetical protein
LVKIQALMPEGSDALDINWAKQIIWVEDVRVVAPSEVMLLPRFGDKTLLRSVQDDSGEAFRYAVNVSALARSVAKPEGEVEVSLLSD